MKTFGIILIFIVSVLRADAYPARCYYAQFRLLSYVNPDFAVELTTFYNLGSGSSGPRLVGVITSQSNDTVFLQAFHDARGRFQTSFSVIVDSILYKNIPAGVNFINVSYNEITYDTIDAQLTDTLFNVFDSTFTLHPTKIDGVGVMFDYNVSPNPVRNGSFKVNFSADHPFRKLGITIVDIMGRTLFCQNYSPVNSTFSPKVNLDNVPKGIYFIEIIADEQRMAKQLMFE